MKTKKSRDVILSATKRVQSLKGMIAKKTKSVPIAEMNAAIAARASNKS